MYSGNFSSIKTVSEDMGIQVSDLIRMGFEGELSIYAWRRWFHFDLETPDCRNSVDSPILIDDEKYLAELMNGEVITLHIDSDYRFICSKDATDDNYLDGVKVTQSDLFCLRSEIEKLKQKKSVETLKTEVEELKNKKSVDIPKTEVEKFISVYSVYLQSDNFDKDGGLGKLEKQRIAIMKTIIGKRLDPLAIPDREKGNLETICQHDYPLLFDGDTSFDNAWKKSRALFRMANHASFSKRGKS